MSRPPIPQNLEAEQAALGAMLIEAPAVLVARQLLTPADFYREAHRYIYEAICAVVERGSVADLITVEAELNRPTGNTFRPEETFLDLCGGFTYLRNLMDAPATAANIGYYADLVRKESLRRHIAETAKQLYKLVREEPDALDIIAASAETFDVLGIASKRVSQQEKIEFFTVGDFLTKIGEPPPMLVQGLIPEKQLILLAGKPKHGKSFAALDICDSIAQGCSVFGEYEVNKPGPTLYLSMEDSRYSTANRMLMRGIRPGDPRPLYVCTQRFRLNSLEALTRLRTLVEPIQPRLVCVDTAAEALGIKDWSNRSEVTEVMAPLRDFAREVCTIILVCHNRKSYGENGDEIAGTNAFVGAVDGWISFTEKEILNNGDLRISGSIEGRDIRGEIILEMNTTTLHMKALSKEDVATERRETERNQKHEQVRDAFAALGGKATAAQIREILGWQQKQVWAIFGEMVKGSQIKATTQSVKTGHAGRPAPVYELITSPNSPIEEVINYSAENAPIPDALKGFWMDKDDDDGDPFANETEGTIAA